MKSDFQKVRSQISVVESVLSKYIHFKQADKFALRFSISVFLI